MEQRAIEQTGIPRENYVALESICVLPELQGKGIGTKMVEDVLATEKRPVLIGCMEAHLVKYYKRFGFEEMQKDTRPSGVTNWVMIRKSA